VSVVGRIRLMIKLGMETICRATGDIARRRNRWDLHRKISAGALLPYEGVKIGGVINLRLQ
jgi:hypothetical protein